MPKFAPVCPIHIYEQLYEKGPEYIGDYFLLLAHDVVSNRERYAKFFNMLRREKPITIILDNSVIELGTSCNAVVLYEACEIIKPTCLAIPDVLQKGAATYKSANNFLRDWDAITLMAMKYPLMYIPQGETMEDYEGCIAWGAETFGHKIQWIGLARNLTNRVFSSRSDAVYLAQKYFPDAKLHMLGFSVNTADDIFVCRKYGNIIEGIDSAEPLRIKKNIGLQEDLINPGPRGEWWDKVEMDDVLAHNTLQMRLMIGDMNA